jgi:hypothetical protein
MQTSHSKTGDSILLDNLLKTLRVERRRIKFRLKYYKDYQFIAIREINAKIAGLDIAIQHIKELKCIK